MRSIFLSASCPTVRVASVIPHPKSGLYVIYIVHPNFPRVDGQPFSIKKGRRAGLILGSVTGAYTVN